MRIELREITVQDVMGYSKHLKACQGFSDKEEAGVHGMGGRLNIRPIYQREFVYKDAQRNAVINTIRNNFPLNVFYWVENKDGSYEVLDGQQRLISIGQYISGQFSMEWPELGRINFRNVPEDQQDQILNYKLMVYFCEGTDSEKLAWFQTINIAGEKLTAQEIKNAVFSGPWVSDAKRYFSKNNCPAYRLASNYLKGIAIRQDYLETILEWINDGDVQGYMAAHQYSSDASDLWNYFKNVVSWVKEIFPEYDKIMKGLPFGLWFNKYRHNVYDPHKLGEEINRLMMDEEVEKKVGIYEYVLTGDERKLHFRSFSENQRREAYEKCRGVCANCGKHFELTEMEADHVDPWSKGGKTEPKNCQMLCLPCNRRKSDK